VLEGQDYSKLENARKLNQNEYTYNAQWDISLQQRLANDEVLAAYQYTIDQVYQVGEFGSDG
jgi:cell surface protein SprA